MEVQPTWHSISSDASLEKLQTSANGLSQKDAEKRLASYGANRLPQAARRSAFMRFLLQFHNILIYVLICSAAITAFLNHWIDTSVILAVGCCSSGALMLARISFATFLPSIINDSDSTGLKDSVPARGGHNGVLQTGQGIIISHYHLTAKSIVLCGGLLVRMQVDKTFAQTPIVVTG